MIKTFFTIVYFIVLAKFVNFIFRNTFSTLSDILIVVCWGIVFIISVGMAEYTEYKIREKYEKNNFRAILNSVKLSF